jgi:glycosyltransferase involved in cell wall biosynthesis
MKRYLLHDFLRVAGGAERLMLELARAFPDRQLFVSRVFHDARHLFHAGDPQVRSLGSWLSRPLGPILEAIFRFRHSTAFLRDAESVLYSGFYAPFAVEQQQGGRRAYYCHTPPRFAYELQPFYLERMPPLARPAARTFFGYIRRNYEAALARMDVVVANSQNVRDRLRTMLGIESTVVHPPIDTTRFRWLEAGDYFVSLARLAEYKRVELIVRAFLQMPDQQLVVVSGGPQEAFLRRLAADAKNIRFTGWVSEEGLADLVGRARSAIYLPIDEDFGMSPVEAMSAGKPVIGVAEGGLLETVIDGETGFLVPAPPSIDAVLDAVGRMTPGRAAQMREACEANSRRFSKAAFLDKMRGVLEPER